MTPCEAALCQGYAPLFRVKHKTIVYTFATCLDCTLNCILNRMAGTPARYQDCADPRGELLAAEQAFDDFASGQPSRDYQDGPLRAITNVRLKSEEQWLAKYPRGLRRQIVAAGRLNWEEPVRSYKVMVKVEKNTAQGADRFDGFNLLDADKHCRGISVPPYCFRLALGPGVDFVTKAFASERRGSVFYTASSTERDRALWFDWALDSDDWKVAFNGDNFVFVRRGEAVGCDLKRMDMHVHKAALKIFPKMLRRFDFEDEAALLEADRVKSYRVRVRGALLKARIKNTQPSGRGDTSGSNSAIVDILIHACLEAWKPGQALADVVYSECWRLGFLVTIDVVDMRLRPLDLDFLQQRMYLALDGQRTIRAPGNKIGRVLLRTFWTRDRLNKRKYLGLLRGIACSLEKQNRHVPILNDLFSTILERTKGVTPYLDRDWVAKIRYVKPTLGRHFEEHPAAVAELAEHLGVTNACVQRMRVEMRNCNLGANLCIGAEFAVLLDALAAWDL